jgi:hypothetical protein
MTTGLGFAERKEKYPIDKSGKNLGRITRYSRLSEQSW